MNITEILQSRRAQQLMQYVYGWGASIVLIGALFKIQHYPYAGILLTIGMTTEAIIFFLSAFEPPNEQPDWTLVFPELLGVESEKDNTRKSENISIEGLEQLQALLEKISVEPEKLSHLSKGLEKLTKTTEHLSDLSDAALATDGYVQNMNKVADSAQYLSDSYQKTATAIENGGAAIQIDMEKIATNGNNMNASMDTINKNLSSLNAIYEMQLKESNEQLKAAKNLDKVMDSLNVTLENVESYKNATQKLSQNLIALNTIYGNMLSAMSQTSNQ